MNMGVILPRPVSPRLYPAWCIVGEEKDGDHQGGIEISQKLPKIGTQQPQTQGSQGNY